LPIGAAAKAHGRHLPSSTDYIQAEWLSRRLVERAPIILWPTLSYGYYPAFLDFPGSCSLEESIFTQVVHEILLEIGRAGASRILIVNTGISTIAALERVRREAPEPERIGVAHIYRGPEFRHVQDRICEQAHGGMRMKSKLRSCWPLHPNR
jgi:creatinine amidohydrolase